MTDQTTNASLPARVAVALQEKVALDMREEITHLQDEIQRCRRISITGPKGYPIYTEAQFEDGQCTAENPNHWKISLPQPDDNNNATCNSNAVVACPLKDLVGLEIHIGAVRMHCFEPANSGTLDFVFPNDNDLMNLELMPNGMATFHFNMPGAARFCLLLEVGPISNEADLLAIAFDRQDHDFLRDLMAMEDAEEATVRFKEIIFDVSLVTGLLEQIDTTHAMIGVGSRRTMEVDLAPFVLAYQNNQVTSYLLQEVKLCRAYLKRLRSVTIAGSFENPVYAEAQFEEGGFDFNQKLWQVKFKQGQPTSQRDSFGLCRLADLLSVQIYFNGFSQDGFSDFNAFGGVFGSPGDGETFQNNSGLLRFLFQGTIKFCLLVRVSPFRDEAEFWHVFEYIRRSNNGGLGNMAAYLAGMDRAETMIVRFETIMFFRDYFNESIGT